MFIAAAAAGLNLDQEEVKRDLGKSALTDAVRPFMPPQDRVPFSAMTGQSLFYRGETDLAHKVMAVAEEEGAERRAQRAALI